MKLESVQKKNQSTSRGTLARHPTLELSTSTLKVDSQKVSKSEKSSVYLRNLSLESFGNYTCQVSTDKPYFRCVQTTRHLEVVVPPSDGPVLMEGKSDYELGDNVSILCNSGKSKPAPELKWYINGQLKDFSGKAAFVQILVREGQQKPQCLWVRDTTSFTSSLRT
ncbi:uncharacterized protein CEXT_18361 [Caerostris extrusa]|uniref:Ig-like domain-containing protein n=1 Tax=Caerostris extrusa TaxID=172846 RepID=A0AAV4Y4Y1_CAEEX|nr:uncharacterized protein CEXT_18361 [Caerostris extrusa]